MSHSHPKDSPSHASMREWNGYGSPSLATCELASDMSVCTRSRASTRTRESLSTESAGLRLTVPTRDNVPLFTVELYSIANGGRSCNLHPSGMSEESERAELAVALSALSTGRLIEELNERGVPHDHCLEGRPHLPPDGIAL